MKSLFACCLVGLLQFVATQNNAEVDQPVTNVPVQYNNEDHSYLWGARESDDFLITEEDIFQNGVMNKEVYTASNFEGETDIIITAIKAIPTKKDSIEGKPEIIRGGIGHKQAVVQITSAKGHGNYFKIEYYGRLEK